MSTQPPANPPPAGANVVQSLDDLTTAAGLSTLRNKTLPATTGVTTIPVRIGKALSTGQPAP